MMNCSTARRRIHRELDGELARKEQAALLEHLDSCNACRRAYQDLTQLRSALSELARATEPPGEHRAPIALSSPSRIPWRSAIAVAASLVLVLTGWWMIRGPRAHRAMNTIVQIEKAAPVSHQENAKPADAPSATAIAGKAPRARVRVQNQDVIVRPVETANPDVTIIWIYETTRTARNEPDEESQSSSNTTREEST
jgi:predicted anti-sigma-YlaC factor YlaD